MKKNLSFIGQAIFPNTFWRLRMAALAFCLVAVLGASAADFIVKGHVIDAESKEACTNAVLHVYAFNDTVKPIINNVADLDGNFNQMLPKAGKYLIKIEYVGAKPALLPFEVNGTKPVADLGDIALDFSGMELDGVTVTARKPLIQSDGAKLTYDAEQDPKQKTSTMLELLRGVPMVTVDGDDNIKVNGKSDYKIYVNGRPDPMLSKNAKDVLKAMPASAIKKIEVITDPGAKFDAEGSGAILNFITETKASTDGYLLNLNLMSGSGQTVGSIYGLTKVKNVTISANFVEARVYQPAQKGVIRQQYLDNPTLSETRQRRRMKITGLNLINGSLDLSWEPDTLNLFSFSTNFNFLDINIKQDMTLSAIAPSGSKLYSYGVHMPVSNNIDAISAQGSYQHTFGRRGHNLILTYLYDFDATKMNIDQQYNDLEGFTPAYILQKQVNNNYNTSHTAQIDYALPLNGEKHLIEVGSKGLFRRNHANSWQKGGNSYDNLIPNPDNDVRMNQNQDIAAAYASYTGTFGPLNMRAGLRYEYTRMGVRYKIGGHDDFSSTLNDAVPNLSMTYRFSPTENLRLAYNMRISRPTIEQINPFRTSISDMMAEQGNPNLDSEKAHTISLTYSTFKGKISGRFGLGYTFTDNAITNIVATEGVTTIYTYANTGKNNSADANIYVTWSMLTGMQLSVNAGASYMHQYAPGMDLKRCGWSGNVGANWNYFLSSGWSFSAYYGWMSKSKRLQGWSSGYYYYGIGVNKSMLKDKALTLGLRASNMFDAHRKFESYTKTESMISHQMQYQQGWGVTFSISYRLGKLNTQVKKTNADASTDDKAAAGGSNISGGTGSAGGM